jgi:hypothetical protein
MRAITMPEFPGRLYYIKKLDNKNGEWGSNGGVSWVKRRD